MIFILLCIISLIILLLLNKFTMMVGRIVMFSEASLSLMWSMVIKRVNFSTKILPSPPKKPLTAYMIFCKENRNQIVQENPDLKVPQQIKILAEKWTKLSPSLKKPYEDLARENTICYGQAHKAYYENLTEEQKQEIFRLKAKKKESRKLLKMKKALKDSGLPKHPNTAYAIFLQSLAKGKHIKSLSEFSKSVAVSWRKMSEEEKKPFLEKARLEKENYEMEMKKWKENLVAEGHLDLLKSYEEFKAKGKLSVDENISSVTMKKKSRSRVIDNSSITDK